MMLLIEKKLQTDQKKNRGYNSEYQKKVLVVNRKKNLNCISIKIPSIIGGYQSEIFYFF